jgi:hypothetical protein
MAWRQRPNSIRALPDSPEAIAPRPSDVAGYEFLEIFAGLHKEEVRRRKPPKNMKKTIDLPFDPEQLFSMFRGVLSEEQGKRMIDPIMAPGSRW